MESAEAEKFKKLTKYIPFLESYKNTLVNTFSKTQNGQVAKKVCKAEFLLNMLKKGYRG